MRIISIRDNPQYVKPAIQYFQLRWATKDSMPVYEDCISHCPNSLLPLPQWYLLMEEETIIGGAGLVTNDFISRMDLYPWVCALYIEKQYRGHAYGSLLLQQAKEDAKKAGFAHIYLCTSHIGLYERYGFTHIGAGYHPWGGSSRIYEAAL